MNFQLKHLTRVLCAKQCNLGMFLLEKHQWGPLGSDPLQWCRVISCLLNIQRARKAWAALPAESLKCWSTTGGPLNTLRVGASYRVRPLQLQWQSGRVWQVPCVQSSPPALGHRLGMRGHAGTAASSTGRKWVWLQSRCRALLAVSLSQKPAEGKKNTHMSHEIFVVVEEPQMNSLATLIHSYNIV